MTAKESTEAKIREVLLRETSAISLSEKLFSPTGLFNELAGNEQERRAVVSSPLFRQAQDRFHELQQHEAKVIDEALSQLELPTGKFRIRVEPSETR